MGWNKIFWAGINFFFENQFFSCIYLHLKKKLFLKLFRLELKKKSAGIKYFGLELKKKWAGIKKNGLELNFFIENKSF